jgi:hypothetical protein
MAARAEAEAETAEARAARDRLDEETSALAEYRTEVLAEIAEAAQRRDAMRGEIANVEAELAAMLASTEEKRAALMAEVESVEATRDGLLAEKEAVQSELVTLRQTVETVDLRSAASVAAAVGAAPGLGGVGKTTWATLMARLEAGDCVVDALQATLGKVNRITAAALVRAVGDC